MSHLRSVVKRSAALRTPLFAAQNAFFGIRSALPGASRPRSGERAHYLSAAVRVRDEARFLPEWIAHHLGVGVEHFYVYDNGSTDGTREVISPFIERGVVTHVSWPVRPMSPSCYVDFLERFGPHSKWVAFFDADEFLFERTPQATIRLLKACEARPALAVNWRYFGSAGYDNVPSGLITQRFNRADAALDEHVKVIAQPAEVFRYRNPHGFYYRRGRLAVTPDGRRVLGSFATPPAHPVLVLHHYVYRSREDYERKTRRGFAEARGEKDQGRHISRTAAEFHRHNDVTAVASADITRATAQLLREAGVPRHLYETP